MPLFGFVLAYNLARPGAFERGSHIPMMKRLLVAGTLATPMFVALVGWWPLNILFMLLVVVAITYCIEQHRPTEVALAIALFVVGGAFVEFWWFALLICLAAWFYCRKPSWLRLVLLVLAIANVAVVNHNFWALLAVPIILAAPYVSIAIPRCAGPSTPFTRYTWRFCGSLRKRGFEMPAGSELKQVMEALLLLALGVGVVIGVALQIRDWFRSMNRQRKAEDLVRQGQDPVLSH